MSPITHLHNCQVPQAITCILVRKYLVNSSTGMEVAQKNRASSVDANALLAVTGHGLKQFLCGEVCRNSTGGYQPTLAQKMNTFFGINHTNGLTRQLHNSTINLNERLQLSKMLEYCICKNNYGIKCEELVYKSKMRAKN